MANFTPRLPQRRTVFKVISIAVVSVLVAFLALTLYVYKESVGKFQLRRLSLPTRVFADYTPLKSGMRISRDDLLEKLDRLGYRQTGKPVQAGDYTAGKDGVEIFTREFSHPSGSYPAQEIRVAFEGAAIRDVVPARDAQPTETAALEPELLTSILGDQLENRRPVQLNQVPKHLQDAVIVTEDIRFWHHPGVDPMGVSRALFRNVKAGGVTEGGSTLTQQLVKNYYLTSERSVKRKVVEAFMALVLDAKYSKKEILEAYLNDIYLGRNRSISILGVGEASRFYFGKPVSEIGVADSAILAGMIRSPNNNSPFANPARALTRRNTVLELMLRNKKIDQQTYDRARAEPLPKKPFREKGGLTSIPYYVDRVLQEMARDYGVDDVKGRGLQIYTAIDLTAQDLAAKTLENSLRGLEEGNSKLRRSDNPLQGAIIYVDVPSGEIRSLVGGRSYELSQFNRALNSKRLVGSLFKPFVLLTAFEPSLSNQNITPATLVPDTRFVLKRRFATDWSPGNYENSYHGTVTVREALEQSMNSATVRIGLACGVSPIIRTAHTLGVTEEIEDNPAIILGAVGIPPIQMADAYSTIARMGNRLPLRTIRFVTNDRGKVLAAGGEVQPVQVFPARDVYLVSHLMQGVLDRGTAAAARRMGFKRIAAGKTGTTNDKRDAWFIGFTPQTLALTWIGFDDNSPTGLSGGEAAVPMWTRFMQIITAGQPETDFPVPPGLSFVQVDETSGGLSVPECPKNVVINESFKSGTEPSNPCPIHAPQLTQLPLVDQFGNPIALDTAITTTGLTATAPDSQLAGGVFRTDTMPVTPPPPVQAPATIPTVEPPPRYEPPRTEPARPPEAPRTDTAPRTEPPANPSQPPPSTNTSAPPTST